MQAEMATAQAAAEEARFDLARTLSAVRRPCQISLCQGIASAGPALLTHPPNAVKPRADVRRLTDVASLDIWPASSQVEGRKRYEFLEALVVSMDGHLRYFKRGYEVSRLWWKSQPILLLFPRPNTGKLSIGLRPAASEPVHLKNAMYARCSGLILAF